MTLRLDLLICLGLGVALSSGCAAFRPVERLRTPHDQRLYVPIFVDETRGGAVGGTLAEALRQYIFDRDAERYCVSFEPDCLAFDGTVVSLYVQEEAGRHKAVLQTRVRLVGREQTWALGEIFTELFVSSTDLTTARHEWQLALAQKAAQEILHRMEDRLSREKTQS